ncbi:hypothetical protein [Geothrix sp. 21YS21S-2]|uniref:hypothetical protein n=1 Tax=Geothrix sp. 21YS21S-2 TaxID=3068893 RepID=UPI0027B9D243|nr:hypothetical protein [Geothrix sp. 21YS21S-2]
MNSVHQLREARVLDAVQRLGTPNTMEVCIATGLPTRETRAHLHQLEIEGKIQARGRRWTVPSLAVTRLEEAGAQDPYDEEDPEKGCPGPRDGCGWLSLLLVASAAAVIAAMRACVVRVFHGGF